MAHTPTPWRVDQYGSVKDTNAVVVAANGFAWVMSPGMFQDEAKANAAFIVRACNNIEALVADGQFLVDRLRTFEQDINHHDVFREFDGFVAPALSRFCAALALAKGEQP